MLLFFSIIEHNIEESRQNLRALQHSIIGKNKRIMGCSLFIIYCMQYNFIPLFSPSNECLSDVI